MRHAATALLLLTTLAAEDHAAPGHPLARPAGAGGIDLAWLDRCGDETGYAVERLSGGGWAAAGSTGPGSRGLRVAGLPAGTVQRFRVATRRAAGDAWTDVLSAMVAPATAADAVAVAVGWGATAGYAVDRRQFGLNLYKIYEEQVAADPRYRANLVAMGSGFLRIHRAEMMLDSRTRSSGWVADADGPGFRWDRDRVKRCLEPLRGLDAEVMMCLTNFPRALIQPGTAMRLDPARTAEYAAFCADLVRIANVEMGLGIRYWEVFNELDDGAADGTAKYNGDHAALAPIYQAVSAALRAVDPGIRVGGPALAQPNSNGGNDETAFIAGAGPVLDFVSFHTYPTGNPLHPLDQIYSSAQGIDFNTWQMRRRLVSAGRHAEVFHDEYNLSWATTDVRRTDQVSAVFDALALARFAVMRADGACAWNEMDNLWGKTSNTFVRRPSSHVFEAFNRRLVGELIPCASAEPALVDALAVAGAGGPAVALVNRSQRPVVVRIADRPSGPGAWLATEIGAWGRRDAALPPGAPAAGHALDTDSVCILSWRPEPGGGAPVVGGATAVPEALALP